MSTLAGTNLRVFTLRSSFILLALLFACAAKKPPAPPLPQQRATTTLTLYFSKETDKERAMWLVRPYGLEIVGATDRMTAVSFLIQDRDERRKQGEQLRNDNHTNQFISELIEIPPKIFVIPRSTDHTAEILDRLKQRKLRPSADTYPATVDIKVNKDDTEEWELRFVSDPDIVLVGEGNVLYATAHVSGILGKEYDNLRASLAEAGRPITLADILSPLPRPTGKAPPPPLHVQDLSTPCGATDVSGLPAAIDATIKELFATDLGHKHTEASKTSSADATLRLVKYTISGARWINTNKWEYYELAISFDVNGRDVMLRAFIQGWSVSSKSPPDEKGGYPEDIEAEPKQRAKLQSQLNLLLDKIATRFCNVSAQGVK
jgi:hypothetical protein